MNGSHPHLANDCPNHPDLQRTQKPLQIRHRDTRKMRQLLCVFNGLEDRKKNENCAHRAPMAGYST